MNIPIRFAALLAIVAAASPALGDGGDIGVRLVNNTLQTILVEGEPPSQVFGTSQERVFAADLDWSATASRVLIDEPGYASNDTQLLGTSLRFSILKAARVWNGNSFELSSLALGTGLPDLALPYVYTPATDVVVPGYSWIVSDDFHFEWTLRGATQSTGQGIYLAELSLSGQGVQSSLPYWIVLNYGLDEADHDAAIDWVRDILVPSPGGAGAAMALLSLWARRRRRS